MLLEAINTAVLKLQIQPKEVYGLMAALDGRAACHLSQYPFPFRKPNTARRKGHRLAVRPMPERRK